MALSKLHSVVVSGALLATLFCLTFVAFTYLRNSHPSMNMLRPLSHPISPSPLPVDNQRALYCNSAWGFCFHFPISWLQAQLFGNPLIDYRPLTSINLVSERSVGNPPHSDAETVIVIVSVYQANPNMKREQWLATGYHASLAQVIHGNIDTALANAYSGQLGAISFGRRGREDNLMQYDVGYAARGFLSYAAYLSSDHHPVVYAIELQLPVNRQANPTDEEYANSFEEVVSSFRLTHIPH